ncbi:cytosolic phospholipase A2 gamma [Dendropsophus ebraccatus]|uniref:cytosolic phospholipase A2 gamma n=1 Tax=Dendropsophus ebraccatus TaxID=150705 RepID=UPI003831E751
MDISEKIDIVYHTCDPSTTAQVPDAFLRSAGEFLSVQARQKKVREALKKFNFNIEENAEPPVIAILASGGGLRAMVALLGVLVELAKEDILDASTYICGTSGSTWCMSDLYNNDKWSSCMEEMERQMADRLVKPSWTWEKTKEKLKQTFSKEIYSLTSFWAYAFIYKITNEINEHTLSNHQASCESGENPYPIYPAVEKSYLNSFDKGAWFEFTPHLVGFPAYKAFVKTELFGSQFKDGKLVKSHPERDLCYLQGLWGSAFADENSVKNVIKGKIQKLVTNAETKEPLTEDSLIQHIDESLDLEGTCSCDGCKELGSFFSSHDLDRITEADIEKLFNDLEELSHDCETVKLIRKILKCFVKWQWGTTNNYLYEWNSEIPDEVRKKEFLSLIDAGLEINTAYPLMLPPNRKVDLILSFDFSESDPFMTLRNTAIYCKRNGIPFHEINIAETEVAEPSQSCYVFEGNSQGVPDVMHFPLFNNQTCEGKVHELRKKYATFNFTYNDTELRALLEISKLNVKLNKDRILQHIKKLKCHSSA